MERYFAYTMRLLAVVLGGSFVAGVALLVATHVSPSFCANSVSCINNLSAVVDNTSAGFFEGQKVSPPKLNLALDPVPSNVLGVETQVGEKHIYVDLQTQSLYAFEGNKLIMNTLISSGKWHPTPPGEYHIWVKLRSTRMAGGEGADAYDLPNVPYVMFFYNDQVSKAAGFSLHGAYWHNNFGHPMSHGCVNMRIIDAQAIYNWADPPTQSTTTYATTDNPGTAISICSSIKLQDGSSPQCIE